MMSNFNDYQIILQARKSKKFKELDDKVRQMTVELGKGSTTVNKDEYKKLVTQRDQELQAFFTSIKDERATVDKTLYQKIDPKITQKLDSFIAKFPNTKLKNVVLQGPTGTGKTYCTNVIKDALTQKGYTVYFTSTYNLVKRMNDNLYGQDPTATSDLFEKDLLVIDDLGAEPSIKNSDEFLYTVINERYANNRAFMITTNLAKEQIETRYGQRFYGRIFDKSRTAVIPFNGKDLRIE